MILGIYFDMSTNKVLVEDKCFYHSTEGCNEVPYIYVKCIGVAYYFGYCESCITTIIYKDRPHFLAKDLLLKTIRI